MTVLDSLEPDVRAGALVYLQEELGDAHAEQGLGDLCVTRPALIEEAVHRARLVLLAADAARAVLPPTPRQSGPLNVADAQAFRLELGADAVAVIAWMPGDDSVDLALGASGNRGLSRSCSADQFSAVSAAIAAILPSPAPSATPESQP